MELSLVSTFISRVLTLDDLKSFYIFKGSFNNYVDKMRGGGGGQKMSVFLYGQGIKTDHPVGDTQGGGAKNCKIRST